MRKREWIEKAKDLEKEVNSLKKRLPLNKYKVINSRGEEDVVEAHGCDMHEHYCNFWIHPWEVIASVSHPISVKQVGI